jgi:uncharacterized membrane protein YqjE
MIDPSGRPQPAAISSFLDSVGQLVITAMEMAQTRLELIFTELQEGLEGLVGLVLWSLIALMAGAMGLLFGGLALIFAFWDTHRVLVAALIMAAFLVLALAATSVVFGRMRRQRSLFATTLAELAKDREFLRAPP